MPWGEAVDLVEQLRLDMGSRLFMSLAQWKYPLSRQELVDTMLLVRVMNATRGDGERQFVWEWPWAGPDEVGEVTAVRRRELKSELSSRSAFAQLRTPKE